MAGYVVAAAALATLVCVGSLLLVVLDPARHVTTDPACSRYRPPTSRLARWWFDRNRGYGCHVCVPPRRAA